jgi:hypothetical protein
VEELERSADPVRLAYLRHILAEDGIDSVVLDAAMGGLGLGLVVPRLMVASDDLPRAKLVIWQAGAGLDG